jgi:hypothetical protein
MALVVDAGQITIDMNDFMKLIGYRGNNEEKRREVWRWLIVLDSLRVVGQRFRHNTYDNQEKRSQTYQYKMASLK